MKKIKLRMRLGATNTHRDASFIEVRKTFLQLCVQNLLWDHNEPRQADRKQTEEVKCEDYSYFIKQCFKTFLLLGRM